MRNALTRMAVTVTAAGLLSACGPGKQDQAAPAASSTTEVAATPAASGPAEFTGTIAQMTAGGNCALDALNGVTVTSVLTVKKTDSVTLGGWMANSAGAVPTDARLVLQGAVKSYAIPVNGGGTREDVAEVMKSEALRTAGFELPLDLAGAQAGTYDLAIVMGSDAHVCPLNIKLAIVD